MKRYKREDKDKLEIGEVFYAKRFTLTVDKSLCKGCVICKLACPREAISFKPVSTGPDGKTLARAIDIDENKCDYHGICAVACPFSAIKITMNGEEDLPAVSRDVFPVLIRDIEIDSGLCEPGCKKCEEKCLAWGKA
jgi:4Fe-4S ferredoxin